MTQTIHVIENYLKPNTTKLKQNSMSFILQLNTHCLDAAHHVVVYQDRATNRHGHMRAAHTKLPVTALPTFEGDACSWLHYKDIFEALIVNNTALSNVQKFHYLIVSHQNEVKDLISNLQFTNENFLVAWQIVTQSYNNKRFIAMMHAKLVRCHLYKRVKHPHCVS